MLTPTFCSSLVHECENSLDTKLNRPKSTYSVAKLVNCCNCCKDCANAVTLTSFLRGDQTSAVGEKKLTYNAVKVGAKPLNTLAGRVSIGFSDIALHDCELAVR